MTCSGDDTMHYRPTLPSAGEIIWTTWYFFVIYAVVALCLVLVFTMLCYFCASNLDICVSRRRKMMKMDVDQEIQPTWLDSMGMGKHCLIPGASPHFTGYHTGHATHYPVTLFQLNNARYVVRSSLAMLDSYMSTILYHFEWQVS